MVANNFIYNVRANGTSTDQPVGIGIAGGHTDKVVFTSISMTGDMDPAGATASAIYGNAMRVSQQPATHANLTLMNNSIYLDVNSNTAANLFYAITLPSATYAFGTGGLDYNNYYINPANTQLRTGGVGVTSGNTPGTSFQTLANWQAALTPAQDANSKQADPLYVSNTSNLHIQSASPNESMGTSITGVTDDIDSDARGATPDIGADEIVAAIPGTVQFASATYSVGEGGGSVALSVTRTGGSSGAISVGYSFFAFGPNAASGAASCGAGIDFAAVSGTLNWADGDSAAKTINVTICEDALFEGDETFYTQLQTPTGGAVIGAQNSTLVTITDNDAQPSLQFGFAAYGAGEGGGNAIISVTRTGTTGNAVSVNYATVAGGSATGGASSVAGVDYQNTSGTLNFAAGVTSQTFNVPICDDALTEPNETVNLALSTPGGGAVLGAQNTAVLTITDNDADTIAPVITYTLIPTNSFNPTLNATITDTVGVTGATIFWRINGGGYTSAGCSLSGGTAQSGTWSCQITGMANPNAVSYYVTATDAAANTATKPTGGASAPNLFTFGAATVPAGTYANMSLGNGAFLGGNVVVNGSLTINGVINTGANTLTLECGVSITGGGEFNYIVGKLERRFCGVETFTFPVGAAFALPPVAPDAETLAPEGGVSNYSPLTVTVTSGTVGSSLTVSVTDAFMDGAVQVNSISRYWTLTENGNLTANLAFTYRNEDVVGNESSWNVLRRESGSTSNYPGGTVNGATNTFNAPNVSNFSQWSAGVAVPTAASAEISGRLTTASGEGIRNATVMLTGGNLTQPVYVQTGTFGIYRFGDLPVGQIYVVTVISKRYTFANPSRVINLTDSVTGEDFAAEEQ